MKNKIIFFLFLVFTSGLVFSNGVVFDKSQVETYLRLTDSKVEVLVESQVSLTTTTQTFLNNLGDSLTIKYAFPLPEDASATKLRYKINGIWYTADFSPTPQDTTTGGGPGEQDYNLKNYLGNNPLYFDIEHNLGQDSTIIVELSYVELLKYKYGEVKYYYPNNYQLIQSEIVNLAELSFTLNSERTIEEINLLSHTAASTDNSGNQASIGYIAYEQAASADYYITYSLNLEELGLFCLSTFIADSLTKDEYGRGFFAFIVEPDPSENTDVIDKVFTLIIDRSGSMSGDKIVQARNAAKFIVENLNEGDKFNIISFADYVTTFRAEHVDFNTANESAALNYINSLDAGGSTNISSAFSTAVPQFSVAGAGTANIIIFFTDGEQTSGIIDTDELTDYIDYLIIQSEKQISVFTFGIGSYTNERLLTTIANNNSGICEFLANSELEDVITDFYLMIRNPVLLNTGVTFSPAIINELYPGQLPNLYKGQQMILVGRYEEAAGLTATITGNAYSSSVEYIYYPELSDTANSQYQFLTKLWAKKKIEDLLIDYYLNLDNTSIAESIKEETIDISLNYGVISPFTSFTGGGGDEPTGIFIETPNIAEEENKLFNIKSIYPNPCSEIVEIVFEVKTPVNALAYIKLIDSSGKVVFSDSKLVNGINIYRYLLDINELYDIHSGLYYVLIEFDGVVIGDKLIILRSK
jgi:Ca-activated chloride channel family protein